MRTILVMSLLVAGCVKPANKPDLAIAPPEDDRGRMEVVAEVKPEAPRVDPTKLTDLAQRPAVRPGTLDDPTPPVRTVGPTLVGGLDPVLPVMPESTPKVPRGGGVPRPHMVTPEAIGETFSAPSVPPKPTFATGDRVKVPSERVEIAPPLPELALPPIDRVSLDDPTGEGTLAAILIAPLPERTIALPFVPVSVPEPFEWRKPLLTPLPVEDPTPIAPTPGK